MMSPQKGHLCYYDRDSNQLKLYFADENNPASLFAPSIRYYYTDRQQNVWITNDRGVDKISFYPNKIQNTSHRQWIGNTCFSCRQTETSLGCFQKGKRQNLPSGWDIRRLPFSTGHNHPSRGYFRKKCVLFYGR